MQFSYRVTEAEYQRAWKLRFKGVRRTTVETVMFWVFILVCLMMLWAVVQKSRSGASPDSPPPVSQTDQGAQAPAQDHPRTVGSLAANVGPFLLIGALWCFMLFKMVPRAVRRMYRKDPAMQGEYTVDITPDRLGVENTAGISAQNAWSLYEWWREDQDIIVLLLKSGAYFILSVRQLSEMQRNELRGILSSALPQK